MDNLKGTEPAQNLSRFGTLRVPGFLLYLGIANALIALIAMLSGIILYIKFQDPQFSIWSTSISEIGASREWAARSLNSGLLLLGALRFLFFFLLIRRYAMIGDRKKVRIPFLILAVIETVGGVGVGLFPLSLNSVLHFVFAGLYFLGLALMMLVLFGYELKLRVPWILPLTSMALALPPLVYLTLNILLGMKNVAVWEWAAFVLLLIWELTHCTLLRNDQVALR